MADIGIRQHLVIFDKQRLTYLTGVHVCMLVLTLALSCVVRAETFSWEASSSLRSLRICKRNKA